MEEHTQTIDFQKEQIKSRIMPLLDCLSIGQLILYEEGLRNRLIEFGYIVCPDEKSAN